MLKHRFITLLAGVVVLAVAAILSGCPKSGPPAQQMPPEGMKAMTGKAPQASGEQVLIKGSDTMLQLSQAWAEEFMKTHPGANISVTGGGSGVGITAITDGTCQIANSSRKIKDTEITAAKAKSVDPKEHIMAHDGIAIIVNKANPVTKLTIDQLSDIFTGKTTNWKQVGGKDGEIVVLSRESSSGTHVYMKEEVLNKGDAKGKAEYAKSVLFQPSTQAICDLVAQNEKAIGYVGLGYVTDKFKVVGVSKKSGDEPVAASVETVASGKYPISRPLMCYTNGEPAAGAIKDFLDWCLAADGQKVVKDKDFVPLGEQKK